MAKILLVEDDKKLAQTVQLLLELDSHTVEMAHDGTEAEGRLAAFDYDLLILDWDLPEKSGVDICRAYRSRGGSTPVLMLTGKQSINEKEEGFTAGADDYLTKPYNPRELAVRVKALLRRMPGYTGDKLKWHDVEVDLTARKVMRGGEEIALQPMEFTLLSFFLKHPGQVIGTEALLKRCWEDSADVSSDSIYTCIRRVRKKIDREGMPSIIRTVHGVGYALGE
jgi:DNA-binding response OmpR family regulator